MDVSRMFTVAPASPEDWTIALAHALAHVPPSERGSRVAQCRDLLATGTLDPRGLFVAREDGAIIAAQVCVPLAGAACQFWLPSAAGPTADALVRAGLAWCRSWGCKIAQGVFADGEEVRTLPLVRHGFRVVTRLRQMEHGLANSPAQADLRLRFESYRPPIADEFAATLATTYEGTLDCPELNGRRTIDEIIAGHRGQGRFDPDFWWLAYVGDQPAGVILLDEMLDAVSWELAYLGVVPAFRGRGLGRAMTLHALASIADRATRLTLVVDERNHPARRLYESLGFVEIEVSNVLLYFF